MLLLGASLVAALLFESPGATLEPLPSGLEVPLAASRGAQLAGDFESALRYADAAVGQTSDPMLLSRIHLMRGQYFAAMGRPLECEKAFELALSNNPEAALDSESVAPSVVGILEGVRRRLRGVLGVVADSPGPRVLIDGKRPGTAPLEMAAPTTPQDSSLRLFVELAAIADPFAPSPFRQERSELGLALEGGVGAGGKRFRGSLRATAGSVVIATARGSVGTARVDGSFGFYAALELPVIMHRGPFVGVGAAGGVALPLGSHVEPFVELQARHFFAAPQGDVVLNRDYLLGCAGVRFGRL